MEVEGPVEEYRRAPTQLKQLSVCLIVKDGRNSSRCLESVEAWPTS
jgi:hypothetical protein